jgi:hypothetical protein
MNRYKQNLYNPIEDCVECTYPNSSDAFIKRRNDKFAVPLCSKHYGDTENLELVWDDIQGFYYTPRDY